VSRRKPSGPRKVSKTERWLNLLAFLLDRRLPVSREQILSEVDDYRQDWLTNDPTVRESVRRKFERDKRDLRALGITIQPERTKILADHSKVEVEAYLLRARDLYLPYLELEAGAPVRGRPYHLPVVSIKPEDLSILRRAAERVLALGATPLGASAASALRKLSFDLPVVAGQDGEIALTGPISPATEKIFATLREGVEERTAVRCRYYSIGRDQEEERVVEPYGLMLTWGRWYCIGRSRERNAMRVFRIDRIRTATLLEGEGSRFEIPADFSVKSYLDRALWELSDAPGIRARVRIGFPHSRWVLAEGLGRVVEALDDAGGVLLEFDVRVPDSFIRWLLPFGPQAEIVQPADLAARLRAERERVRALYS
jgi:predicted DNA-binding transcriptional regulator YafY